MPTEMISARSDGSPLSSASASSPSLAPSDAASSAIVRHNRETRNASYSSFVSRGGPSISNAIERA